MIREDISEPYFPKVLMILWLHINTATLETCRHAARGLLRAGRTPLVMVYVLSFSDEKKAKILKSH